MITRRKVMALGAVVVAASIGLTSCANAESPEPASPGTEKVSMTFVTPYGYLVGFAPVLTAKGAGYFSDNGLDVHIEGGTGSSQAVQQLVSGAALISRTGGLNMIKAVANQDADIIAIGTIDQTEPYYMISSPDDPIESAKDLAGKTIGIVSAGGDTEDVLNILASDAGIDSVSKEIVGNAPGAFELVLQGKIDAYIATGSTVVQLREAGMDIHAWSVNDAVPLLGEVYIARRSTLEKNAPVLRAFLESVFASVSKILSSEGEEWAYKYLQEFPIEGIKDKRIATESLKIERPLYVGPNDKHLSHNVDIWESTVKQMVAAGIIAMAPENSLLYTEEFTDGLTGGLVSVAK